MIINIADLLKQNQGTYNYPTFIEITGIFIDENDFYTNIIKRDIIIRIKKGRLQRISYWYSVYMVL